MYLACFIEPSAARSITDGTNGPMPTQQRIESYAIVSLHLCQTVVTDVYCIKDRGDMIINFCQSC